MKTFAQYLQELASSPYYGKYSRDYGDTSVERETMESDKQTHKKTGLRADRRYDDVETMRARRDTSTGRLAPVSNQSGKFGGGV